MTSSSDTFAWLDKVIHEHQVRGQEYSNEKDRMMQALMEENEYLKRKLMQYENGIYNQELKARIGELEDEKKEMFIRFKEISILKEKQIGLLNEKIESMKKIMNDEMDPLSNVPNEKDKDTLTQYLKVINAFLDKINHHLVNYSSTPLNEKDKGNEIAILEAKFKIIEYVLQQNEVSNDNNNKDNKEIPILNTRNQSNQFNSTHSVQSGESNKSKRSNQSNSRKKGNIK